MITEHRELEERAPVDTAQARNWRRATRPKVSAVRRVGDLGLCGFQRHACDQEVDSQRALTRR
jgi:hypothetical protein